MINILSIIICLFTFLFSLYLLVREDYILFRKNVSLETVFNIAFIILLLGLISARLFYVAFHFKRIFLNPLVFLHILNYPGLSLIGAIIGPLLVFLLYYRSKKLPLARLSDIFMLAFLFALPFTLLPSIITKNININFLISIVFFILYIIISYIALRLFLKWKTQEGRIGVYILITFCCLSLAYHFLLDKTKIISIFSGEELMLLLLLVFSLFLFIKQSLIKN